MNIGKNLAFCREEFELHDVLMETTDESKTKEAVIGITSIIGEMKFNHKSMAARLDVLEDSLLTMKMEITQIVTQIRIMQDKLFTGTEIRINEKSSGQGG